ncbi:ribosome maturation factor RimP [Propionibacteriaceae bacterium Y1685]|uniref:ribosome maturation factor RimP n=1 Tax=Microlunatus sp. Y1700 TaxID=3418487 RepID=UPI003B76128C
MNEDQITAELTPLLAGFGLELEAIEVQPAGRRTLLRVVVDGDGPDGTGPGLDDLAEATKAVSAALDESESTGAAPYTLEVSSRGVNRPLTEEKHWRRNSGRLVKVTTVDASEPVIGRVTEPTADRVTLDVSGTPTEIAYADITKALVQVEFNRKKAVPLDVDPDLIDPDETDEHDQDEEN